LESIFNVKRIFVSENLLNVSHENIKYNINVIQNIISKASKAKNYFDRKQTGLEE